MSDKPYNGWSNYETWLVNLWLDNEEYTYNLLRNEAKKLVPGDYDEARYALSEWIKSYVLENAPDLPAGLYTDLISGALGVVDWREIATSVIGGLE